MKSFGSLMVFLAVGSFVLNVFDYEFVLLMWIDMWGIEVGWVIRIVMIVAGAAMWFMGGGFGSTDEDGEMPNQPETD